MSIKKVPIFLLFFIAFIMFYPICFIVTGSLMSEGELNSHLAPMLEGGEGTMSWALLPLDPSLHSYIELLFDTPSFFVSFWNSVVIVIGVLVGQLIIAVPAAWGFARYKFRFHNVLFTLYILLMAVPFVCVMLQQYIVLNELNLLDKLLAIIIPGIFSTFPIFIMWSSFKSIPESIIEAARIDGASELSIFLKIGIPLGSGGIITAMVLSFIEYWNIVEQPLLFIKDPTLWPLSLVLPSIPLEQAGLAFAASVITLIPSLLVFLVGRTYLEQGIVYSSLNE